MNISEVVMSKQAIPLPNISAARSDRRFFIGGSDARVIMGGDEAALLRLWKEKRCDVEIGDLSGDLLVQLGTGTRRTPGKSSPRCSGSFFTPSTAGWRQP